MLVHTMGFIPVCIIRQHFSSANCQVSTIVYASFSDLRRFIRKSELLIFGIEPKKKNTIYYSIIHEEKQHYHEKKDKNNGSHYQTCEWQSTYS